MFTVEREFVLTSFLGGDHLWPCLRESPPMLTTQGSFTSGAPEGTIPNTGIIDTHK